jgi:hypothetical protein
MTALKLQIMVFKQVVFSPLMTTLEEELSWGYHVALKNGRKNSTNSAYQIRKEE